MNTLRSSTPRLLAGFGTLALLGGIGLASSRPAHTAGGPIAVNVANTPLATTATDNKDKQAVQFSLALSIQSDRSAGDEKTAYTVPTGKRLIIESVTATANNIRNYDTYDVRYRSDGGGLGNQYGFGGFSVYAGGSYFSTSTSYSHLYAEAGQEIHVQIFHTNPNVTGYCECNFSGYLVDIATPGGSS